MIKSWLLFLGKSFGPCDINFQLTKIYLNLQLPSMSF